MPAPGMTRSLPCARKHRHDYVPEDFKDDGRNGHVLPGHGSKPKK
jgi:hypothetical protein